MSCRQLQLWICLVCSLYLCQGAQVYMEFNGLKYAYDTDGLTPTNQLSPNYELPQTHTGQWPHSRPTPPQTMHSHLPASSSSYSSLWGFHQAHPVGNWVAPRTHLPAAPPTPQQPRHNIDFTTQQMSHTQHTDPAGYVLGKYSYYDEAGYHELSYKAGAGIGFVVMGGNLAKPTVNSEAQTIGSTLRLA